MMNKLTMKEDNEEFWVFHLDFIEYLKQLIFL